MKLVFYSYIFLCFFSAFSQSSLSQGCRNNIFLNESVQELRVFKYKKNHELVSFSEFNSDNLTTPESFIGSLISCKDLSCLNKHRKKKADKFVGDSSFKLTPLYKVTYKVNKFEYAFLKLFADSDAKSYSFVMVLKKDKGKWYINDDSTTFDMMNFISFVKTDYLNDIFLGRKTKNIFLNSLLNKARKNGVIDLNYMAKEIKIMEDNYDKLQDVVDKQNIVIQMSKK